MVDETCKVTEDKYMITLKKKKKKANSSKTLHHNQGIQYKQKMAQQRPAKFHPILKC